jgi:hypothetical protein
MGTGLQKNGTQCTNADPWHSHKNIWATPMLPQTETLTFRHNAYMMLPTTSLMKAYLKLDMDGCLSNEVI